MELCPLCICATAYAGDSYSVDAVMNVVYSLLLCILLLQPPHLAEIGGSCTLDRVDSVEDCFEIHLGISADNAYVDTLTIAEAL